MIYFNVIPYWLVYSHCKYVVTVTLLYHLVLSGAVPRKGEKKSQEPRIYKEGLLCTICGGKFKSSVQLTDHRATMHGGKRFIFNFADQSACTLIAWY